MKKAGGCIVSDTLKSESRDYSCPSAPADGEDAQLLGVVLGTAEKPEVFYVSKDVDVSVGDVLDQVEPTILPTRIFRFSARCQNGGCAQFDGQGCRLGKDVANLMAPVTQSPPACNIRKSCRWFAENGPSVCLRCSRIVTTVTAGDELMPIAEMVKVPDQAPALTAAQPAG